MKSTIIASAVSADGRYHYIVERDAYAYYLKLANFCDDCKSTTCANRVLAVVQNDDTKRIASMVDFLREVEREKITA